MLDKRTGKPTSVSPRDAAVRRHFYSIDVDDGRRDPGIEEVLSKIESIAAPLVRRVEEGDFPVREQRLELAMFVAVCWLRTPAWREQMGSVMEQATTNLVAKSYALDPEMAQRAFADSDMSSEEIEQFREEFIEGLATGRFKVTFPKNLMLRYFLEGAVGAQWTMFLLDWTVVRLPDDYEEFVIADNPFSLFDPTPAFPGGGSGLLSSPNAQGFMPLGPRTGILLEATSEIWAWARENLQLAYYAGLEGSVVVNNVRTAAKGQGLNVDTNEVEDLVKAGIIDPTMVTRAALQNAASIAKNILMTEAIVAEPPEKAGAGMGGGMGGMGDMGGMM
jgi:hypothetical protein